MSVAREDAGSLPDRGLSTKDGRVAAFRAEYRATKIGHRYSAVVHAALVVVVSGLVILVSAAALRDVRLRDLWVLPASFVIANLGEYLGHRFPMHRRTRFLRRVYERHTREHHRFFTDCQMGIDERRDAKVVLFPPVLLVFFFSLGAILAFVINLLLGRNAAYLFLIVVAGYYLLYECLHLAYHLPENGRAPLLLRRLREHHRLHHNPALMRRYNLNITFPIGDFLFGTVCPRAEQDPNRPSSSKPSER